MADSANPMASVSADMMNSIPADMMAEFNAAADLLDPSPESFDEGTTPVDDGVIETPVDDGVIETPATEEAAAETEVPATETQQANSETAATEELPEGVVAGKNRKGEEGVFVRKERWDQEIYANHKMVLDLSEILGEPATREALVLREKAYQAQEKLFTDLESGDPATQSKVLDFIFDQLADAKQSGRVGADPAVPLARSFYSSLQTKAPEAYAAVRGQAARDLVKEMYAGAARSGDKNLFLSVGHVARWLTQSPDGDPAAIRAVAQRMGISFHTPDEMDGLRQGVDPQTQLRLENQRLQEQLNGRSTTTQAEQFGSWTKETTQATTQAVIDEAIKPALASIEAAWKPFAKDYDSEVVNPLRAKVFEVLNKDPEFQARINNLTIQAQRATSPQFRAQIATQIKQAHVNRARLAADANRRTVIDRANTLLNAKNSDTHARRTAGQTRTAPQGQTAAVPRSLVPKSVLPPVTPNEVYDPQRAYKLAASLLG